jgi:hypothetical protein
MLLSANLKGATSRGNVRKILYVILRFNDLRGTKVTEMVWSGISVPDLAIRIGWKIETAAKMLGVCAALNPGRAAVVALPGLVKRDDATI